MPKREAPRTRRISLSQAMKIAADSGLTVVRTEIHPDGRIVLVHAAPVEVPATPFDEWKAKRDARQT